MTNTTRHPSRGRRRSTPVLNRRRIYTRRVRARPVPAVRQPRAPIAANPVDDGTMINSLQDECHRRRRPLRDWLSHPARRRHRPPRGGFTPFDRIELDIFALIIRRGCGGVSSHYTNNNNTRTHKRRPRAPVCVLAQYINIL